MLDFEIGTKSKVSPYASKYQTTEVEEFWTLGRSIFQQPTMAHGCVSRPERTHARVTMPWWLSHCLPPHVRRCWPPHATCPSRPHALPCVHIPSSPRLCSVLRTRAAPQCRASPPTGTTPSHIKPLR
jgi:hypothetical protein